MQEPMKYSIENTSTGGRRVMVKMKKKCADEDMATAASMKIRRRGSREKKLK